MHEFVVRAEYVLVSCKEEHSIKRPHLVNVALSSFLNLCPKLSQGLFYLVFDDMF